MECAYLVEEPVFYSTLDPVDFEERFVQFIEHVTDDDNARYLPGFKFIAIGKDEVSNTTLYKYKIKQEDCTAYSADTLLVDFLIQPGIVDRNSDPIVLQFTYDNGYTEDYRWAYIIKNGIAYEADVRIYVEIQSLYAPTYINVFNHSDENDAELETQQTKEE